MIFLLCEPDDCDALWLAAALRRHGESAEVVLPSDLMVASELSYWIDSANVRSSLRLQDGRAILEETASLVVNRLDTLPAQSAGPVLMDALYLAEEWRAAMAAWLRTLRCPVLNPPRAASLAGPVMSTAAWRAVARAHGIPAQAWQSGSVLDVAEPADLVCVGGRCVDPTGAVPPGLAARLAAMSRYVGAPLLGATFDSGGGAWELVSATARPPLASAGPTIVEAIIACARGGLLG